MKGLFWMVLVLSVVSVVSAKKVPEWQDPQVVGLNKQKPRASFYTRSLRDAKPEVISLNGPWKFNWFERMADAPEKFYKTKFDDSQWTLFDVPSNWEFKGLGIPYGHRHVLEFEKTYPPTVPTEENPVGCYRRTFELPEGWGEKQVYIHFGAVKSAFYIWINDEMVGYSQGSKTPAEWNITGFVKPGQNSVALQVIRWSDGSFLEGQDFWRISGIERDVYLYAAPYARIADFRVNAGLDSTYTNGIFDIQVALENRGKTVEGLTVLVELNAPDGANVYRSKTTPLALKRDTENVAGLRKEVGKVQPWSAELPVLYDLHLTLINGEGAELEYISTKVGFRSVELKNAHVLVNGKPVLFKGVNRHEHDPVTAHVISRESMEKDLALMKALNFNAVRTCHYPNDPYWYELCDQYGMYIVDEADIKSPGYGAANQNDGSDSERNIANNSEWQAAYLDRIERMFERDKNHPSVIFWSIGSGTDGANLEACYDWLKRNDATRPVMFEPAQLRRHTDVYAQRYASIALCENYALQQPARPMILSEYAYAMGNSLGNLKEYGDLFETYDVLQGGFIWSWADQCMLMAASNGVPYFAYGGDIEPAGITNSGSFCANGVVGPDRSFNPHAYEVKKVQQPIAVEAVDLNTGLFKVKNKNWFADLSRYVADWKIEGNGVIVAEGRGFPVHAAPQSSTELDLDYTIDPQPGVDYFLTFSFKLKETVGLLPKGTEVAWEQFKLPFHKKALAPLEYPELALEESEAFCSITNDQFSVVFSKKTGEMTSLKYNGIERMKTAPRPDFWRVPTDNDFGEGVPEKLRAWRYAANGSELRDFKVERLFSGVVTVRVDYYLSNIECRYFTTYTVKGNGDIQVSHQFYAAPHKKQPEMPRFGTQLELPLEFSNVEWFGRGPHENYIDRKMSAPVGLYRNTVDGLYFQYIRPQENGYRTDVRRVAFFNDAGQGIEFVGEPLICFGAQRFAKEDYENDQKSNAHFYQMTPRDRIFVNIDWRQRGIAGTTSWGEPPLFKYTLPYLDYHYSYTIRPFKMDQP